MHIDFEQLTSYQRYKLMAGLIAPRPIALVTTLSEGGVVNAAPFSMFNMVGEDPPLVMVSINRRDDDTVKDTAVNIVRTGEFVVHICDQPLARSLHACSRHLPPTESEVEPAGLTTIASTGIAPPRVAEAPVAFECTLYELMETKSRQVFFGQIRHLHVRSGLVDTDVWRVDLADYLPIGRMGGTYYSTTWDRFVVD